MTDPDAPDVELLADLDAGLLDPARADEVRRAALADPRSAAVLDALAATRADLAALPVPPVPPGLRHRTAPRPASGDTLAAPGSHPGTDVGAPDAARADSAGHPSTPEPSRVPTDAAGTRRGTAGPGRSRPWLHRTRPEAGRRARWVLAAAVVAAVALVSGVLTTRPDAALDVSRVELAAVARSTVGLTDLGDLTDPARRDACRRAAGLPGATVLGGRQVRLDGTSGVLLVLSTGVLGRFRVLVVTPSCAVLDDTVVGGP